jgi:hypothetical protein
MVCLIWTLVLVQMSGVVMWSLYKSIMNKFHYTVDNRCVGPAFGTPAHTRHNTALKRTTHCKSISSGSMQN